MKKNNSAIEEEEVAKAIPLRIKSDLRKRPYGLCEGVGISTSGLSPREAWAEWNAYRKEERERAKKGKKKSRQKRTVQPKPSIVGKDRTAPSVPSETPKTKPAPVVSISEKKTATAPPASVCGVKIPSLSAAAISTANSHSMFDRGSHSNTDYQKYVKRIMAMDISDGKKQQLVNELHKRWSKLLSYEAAHVPWTVAGPARYNAKKLNKAEKIIQTGSEIAEWFDRMEKSVENSKRQYRDNSAVEAQRAEEWVRRVADGKVFYGVVPQMVADALLKVAPHDPQRFAELYEEYDKQYHFRGNTNAAKLYKSVKAGTFQKAKPAEKLHETDNLNAYRKRIDAGERVFLKFTTRPKPQLVYALKRRGWHWNAYEQAWSVPAEKYDAGFVAGIDEQYKKYL